MASKVDICNLAIAHIGAKSISALDQLQKEAYECKRFYDVSRQAVLRAHKWGFSIKQQTLALISSDEYLEYDYSYAYPVNALLIHKIYNVASKNVKLEYVIRAKNDESGRVILTDEAEAKILYTANIENTNLFDSLFTEALGWRLAADIAQPIRGDKNLQDSCLQKYFILIEQAKTNDSNESYIVPNDDSSFVEARV